MWQERFEKYRDQGFIVVGLALDAEGIGPAQLYYEKFGVTFPALVDPNYATGFGAVPKTFFVDEFGVVQDLQGWEEKLSDASPLKTVSEEVRAQWTENSARLRADEIARLLDRHLDSPSNLEIAVDLASRYLDLDLTHEAAAVLDAAVPSYDPHRIANSGDAEKTRQLGEAYFQWSRAAPSRAGRVSRATIAFYLNPSVGYGKQISRIISPERFDGRPGGDFDNEFREATLRRLQQDRKTWLGRARSNSGKK